MATAFHWYQWLALAGLAVCMTTCLLHFLRLIRLGKPVDFSRPAKKKGNALRYAFTGAMSPAKKESAYLHLPTYTAGIFYHLGTFLSFILFFFILTDALPTGWLSSIMAAFLLISTLSGLAILIKRIVKKELKSLSNPDDFISNILVTLFQIATLSIILYLTVLPSYRPIVLPSYSHNVQLIYYLTFTLLTLYIPVGKLRHMVYFFAARYHLGYFFGWRGVWPSGKANN
jgi:hypothetical protein